ncbi:Gfo/Idh/MocA family oxidoreductase [bacterium]|nr:Gfo/Idh/MocA family oxidoreductase [bacterium]
MINVALIGAGAHSAGNHAPALQKYAAAHPDDVRLAVVCDLDRQRAATVAKEFGFDRAVGTTEELFGPGTGPLDALVAVLPYAGLAVTLPPLFARGLPLLIEKPLGANLGEAEAIHQAAIDTGVADRVMVSFNRRYDPALVRAKAWLDGQPPPRYVRATMTRTQRTEPDFVWGTGVHLIDALQHLLGPLAVVPGSVTCPGGHADAARIARLNSRQGAEVLIEIIPTAGTGEETIRIIGDEYQLDLGTGAAPPWRVRAVSGFQVELDEQGTPETPAFEGNGTDAETVAFLDAVVAGHALPPPSLADALDSSRLAARIAQPE